MTVSALSTLSSIAGISGLDGAVSAPATSSGGGFGSLLAKGLESVSSLENNADNLAATFAAGGNVQIYDLMAATSKANLGMSVLNEIRNKGLEAYQSIINIQI